MKGRIGKRREPEDKDNNQYNVQYILVWWSWLISIYKEGKRISSCMQSNVKMLFEHLCKFDSIYCNAAKIKKAERFNHQNVLTYSN